MLDMGSVTAKWLQFSNGFNCMPSPLLSCKFMYLSFLTKFTEIYTSTLIWEEELKSELFHVEVKTGRTK